MHVRLDKCTIGRCGNTEGGRWWFKQFLSFAYEWKSTLQKVLCSSNAVIYNKGATYNSNVCTIILSSSVHVYFSNDAKTMNVQINVCTVYSQTFTYVHSYAPAGS